MSRLATAEAPSAEVEAVEMEAAHGAHHEEAAQQGHESTGQEAVGCRCGQLCRRR